MSATSEYYKDKVAVVTGAASGIGLALAETMLSYGAKKVVLADVNDENLKRETARLNTAYPGRTLGLHCDVTNEIEVQAMIRDAADFGGRIDILFNNAGRGPGWVFRQTVEQALGKGLLAELLRGALRIRAVLPIMRQQGGGQIVDIVSGIAFAPMAQQSMYSATKAALNALTLALRYELWDENIRVSSATPGVTATGMWEASGVPTPTGAQSPGQSARAILAGVAKNERLVLGDQGDAFGAKVCFNPEAATAVDDYLLNVARKRRSGEFVV